MDSEWKELQKLRRASLEIAGKSYSGAFANAFKER